MSACPWCQAPITEPRFPCRSCGRRPKDHPSHVVARVGPPSDTTSTVVTHVPSMTESTVVTGASAGGETAALSPRPVPGPAPTTRSGSTFELDRGGLGSDVPDLVVPPPSRRGAASASAPPRSAAASDPEGALDLGLAPDLGAGPDLTPLAHARSPKPKPTASAGGMSFDDELEFHDGAGLELASSGGAAPAASGPGPGASEGSRARAPLHLPVAPDLNDDELRDRALELGSYGPVPDAWWMAPVYAYRVKVRQLEIRRDLAAKKAALGAVRAEADESLIAFASRGRRHVEQNDEYGKLIADVVAAEAALRQRDGARAAEADAHKQKTSGLDEQIGRLEAELADLRAQEQRALAHFERVDGVRQRADAKVKRTEIELRAVVARGAPASRRNALPGGVDATESDPEVMAKTAERDARLAELQQALPAASEATAELAAARKRVTGFEEKLLALKNQRAALEAQWKRRGAAHGAEVDKAEKAVRASLAALGRACASDDATFGQEWDEARRDIVARETVAARHEREVAIHALALDAHDRTTTTRGLGIALGVVTLLALLLVIPLALGGGKVNPPAAPPATAAEPLE